MWRNFLILWVVVSVQSTWQCYRNIQLLVEKYGAYEFHVRVIQGDPEWLVEDLSNFQSLLNFDANFNFWMQSLMLRHMAPDTWILEPIKQTFSNLGNTHKAVDSSLEMKSRNLIKASIGRLGFDHVQVGHLATVIGYCFTICR